MEQTRAGSNATGAENSRAQVAAALAAAAVVAVIVLAALEADGPIWFVQGALSLAAAVTGWLAGGATRRNMLAFLAMLVGAVLFLMFVGFAISEAAA